MAQVQLLFIVMAIFGLAVAQFHQQTNQFGAQPQFGQQQYQQPQQQYQQRSSSCPDVNGTYPVSGQCDAYIECKNGVAEEKLCPDGLLFNDKLGPKHFPCQYPIDVSCDNRAKLQPAQSTDECPHQFGYYKMGDRSNCGQFMNCVNGRGFMFDCPEGLAWSQETYRCEWPDQVPDCDAESFVGFTCPPEARTDTLTDYTFYRSAADCQVYYICIEGRPRMYRCSEGKLFNDLTNQCDGAENVTCGGASYRTPAKPVQIQQTSQPRPNVHVSQFNQQQQPKTQFNAFSGFQQQTVQQQTVQPAVAPQQKYYTGLVVPQEQPKQQQQFYTGKIVPQQQQQQFFTGAVVPQAKAVNTFTSFNPTTAQPIVVQDDAVDPFINPRFGSGQEAAPVAPQSQFNSFAAVQPAVVQPRQPESPRFQTRSSINTFGQFNAQSSNRGQKRWEGTF